ncbi:hypothetical protein FRUB_06956 [Fimbriiglobus ruber]|uniref:EF-hand domain-containing protein n=1 Tax=Fimbriiglobus ruber TaxID=1908690 RepID=A0A225DK69_9BACT|nr:hypothetical protein FRUB_06956 [Fimbriiglobus ruber]
MVAMADDPKAPSPSGAAGARPADAAGNNRQNSPQFNADRFIKDHDKNGDGKLSKDELPADMRDEFDKIDANKDGFLTADELTKHAAMMSQQAPQLVEFVFFAIDSGEDEQVTLQDLQRTYDTLRKMDKDNSGKLSAEEFKAFRHQRKEERINNFIQRLDKNGDGKISRDEARGMWADNFSQLDKNGDGFIDRQELEAAFSMHQNRTGTPTPPAPVQQNK